MTFAIVLANADQIIQVSDRRLTSKGSLFDDSYGKAGYAVCDDATFIYCFTGLACNGGYSTSDWLVDALYESAQVKHDFRGIISTFLNKASKKFKESSDITSLPLSSRRLTVMMTGYTADDLIFNALISNFQDFESAIDYPEAKENFTLHFEVSSFPVRQNPTMIQAVGQFNTLTYQDENELREMLVQRKSAEAIRQKAISLVQDISIRPKSGATVGKKINTARLDRSNLQYVTAGYVSDEVENQIQLLDALQLKSSTPQLAIRSMQVHADVPIVFPRVHRNALCTCGSGKKYRFCHRNKK